MVRAPRLALVVASTASAGTTAWAAWALLKLASTTRWDAAGGPSGPLLALAAALAAVVCARLCLAALACAAYGCSAPGRVRGEGAAGRPARACARVAVLASPALLRPLVAALVAGGIAVGAAGTAVAAGAAGAAGPVGTPQPTLPDPGWAPTLAAPAWTPARPTAPPRPQPDVSVVAATALRGHVTAPVVVRRGDTLWAIAARHLGPDATDAQIAEQWPRWWQANRARIGDDPDLLLPGQVLVVPTGEASR